MEVRIFATDANSEAIKQARTGLYPATAVTKMTPQRQQEYFIETERGYLVRNYIGRMLIWAEHDLIEHPPFSNLHLVSCRNILIYFQPHLQQRVMAMLQFVLSSGGLLFLGASETITQDTNAFTALDRKHRVYERTDTDSASWLHLERPLFTKLPDSTVESRMPTQKDRRQDKDVELRIIKDLLVTHYHATCVIVDDNYQVRYTYGEVDRYLQVISGKEGQKNILDMARAGLDIELTIALQQAFESEMTITQPGAWVKTNGDERITDITVIPISHEQMRGRYWLVVFDLVSQRQGLNTPPEEMSSHEAGDDTKQLYEELQQTKKSLQSVTRALQAKSEELSSSMEEIRSASEEAQTANEELRTSKEELESMNEELNNLNSQLTDQNEAFSRANNTLHNFLQSTEIGMIFLDQKLAVREFTSAVTDLFSLRNDDKGRQLEEIANRLNYERLTDDCEFVLDTLTNVEKEIHTRDGSRWYDMKIRPYRTVNNMIDGLVLTFADITAQKQAQFQSKAQTTYVRKIFDTIGQSLLELDSDLRVRSANQVFYQTFRTAEDETVGRRLYELGNGQWDIPELRRLLSELIPAQTIVRDYTVRHHFPRLGESTMRLNARQIAELDRILLVITEVSSAET